jgi:hypothetical protein
MTMAESMDQEMTKTCSTGDNPRIITAMNGLRRTLQNTRDRTLYEALPG